MSSESSPSDGDTDDDCVREVCAEFNPLAPVDDSRLTFDGLLAMRLVVLDARRFSGVEVMTGESSGISTLALWDGGTDRLPTTEITRVTWTMTAGKSWQGGDFDTPVERTVGEYFWIVWDTVADAQASMATVGIAYDYAYSNDDAASWLAAQDRWKMRIYCCQ